MIEVQNVSVHYGQKKVVDNISFTLGDAELLTLVGPTGCGKTTILQALAGLIPISDGTIKLGSHTVTATKTIAPEKRQVGMVFQDFALFPHLTVIENVSFKLKDNAKANHWIELLGLTPWRDAKPANLSGGQKQRVALARTLAHEPAFVLLDEPLSNLDAALKDDLRWEIRQALKEAGVPAIWVTHDQEEALSVGDRIGILKDGKLQQIDTPENCFSKPQSRFVARFLGDASFLPGTLNTGSNIVATALGNAPASPVNDAQGEVDLLLRPDDLSLTLDEGGNGEIIWSRYEGSARLYGIKTDAGATVKIRCSHENIAEPGQRVMMHIITTHPLAVFER
ncbi:MAG: ABC transporter ATP-binding protein [Methylophaga sp.]|uniref:ABC transporter ATP-binding protein n=1 Tax=Methylophaga sp. UBA678 TaxID=1946901 RepID=UPI000C432C1C|nr:ABC transporter ATP-binding protein [Methylophaga sp. UBA678]MAX50637.1 ABC transporter ATP-binding protein [Methylophaga sp.]|tara:strand:- start:9089 stop:10102 length:1014 start_codon:yes stop_codon:yes gene_type:complete